MRWIIPRGRRELTLAGGIGPLRSRAAAVDDRIADMRRDRIDIAAYDPIWLLKPTPAPGEACRD
jgi:hypothetical protein